MTTPKKKRAPRKLKAPTPIEMLQLMEKAEVAFSTPGKPSISIPFRGFTCKEILSGATMTAQRYNRSPFETAFDEIITNSDGWAMWFEYGMLHPEGGEL